MKIARHYVSNKIAYNGFGIGAVSSIETANRLCGLVSFGAAQQHLKFRSWLIAPNAMIAEVAGAERLLMIKGRETLLPNPIAKIRCVRKMKFKIKIQ